METRANHVFVGAITLVLLGLLAAFTVWLVGLNQSAQNRFDIFFRQSVAGLAKGSGVTFSGVPVGKVDQIELWRKDPSFVRVRISVDDNVPVLIGTTATFLPGLTGGGNIQLEGAVRDASPITCPDVQPKAACPEGVPVIPTKRGGLGAILNSAPLLIDRLATVADRLNVLLSDDNQLQIKGILSNTNKLTGNLADASPQVKTALAELEQTLHQASQTLASLDTTANKANALLDDNGNSLASDLRKTLRSTQGAVDELKATLNDTRPAMQRLGSTTLPGAEATLRELRDASRALKVITEKIDDQGAAALSGNSKLPDYKP